MTPRIDWEAAACEKASCGSTVISRTRRNGEPIYSDGDVCPGCGDHTLKVVRNPSLVARIVYVTTAPIDFGETKEAK